MLALAVPAARLVWCAPSSSCTTARTARSSRREALNGMSGWITGAMTMTPFDAMAPGSRAPPRVVRRLDRRGHGDVKTLTVKEYPRALTAARLDYRLIRHPGILLGVGPIHLVLTQRIREGTQQGIPRRAETCGRPNIAIVVGLVAAGWLFGGAQRLAQFTSRRSTSRRPWRASGSSTCSISSRTRTGRSTPNGII